MTNLKVKLSFNDQIFSRLLADEANYFLVFHIQLLQRKQIILIHTYIISHPLKHMSVTLKKTHKEYERKLHRLITEAAVIISKHLCQKKISMIITFLNTLNILICMMTI